MKILCRITLIVIIGLGLHACDRDKEIVLSGHTMGTRYHIRCLTHAYYHTKTLQDKIDKRLAQINDSMSTFNPKSEISQFNGLTQTVSFPISDDFFQVMSIASNLHTLTKGAWDGTVKPLVNLWGFGHTQIDTQDIPSQESITLQLKSVGFHKINLSPNAIQKTEPTLSMNLASIAKGYGVDQIATLLQNEDIHQFVVEIGGEVYASGSKKDGSSWRVGINRPAEDASFDDVYFVISLQNKAIATSGDYRNFHEINQKRYSHVIDPRTGWPVSNGIVSVSVIADSCTFADGLATALMVMGVEQSLNLVNQMDGVECMIVVSKEKQLTNYFSTGFHHYTFSDDAEK